MRILMVTADFPPDVGGIQTYSLELARGLANRAAAFELVAPWRRASRAVDRAQSFAVRRVPAPNDGLALSGIAAVSLWAKRLGADVVFAAHWSCAHAALWSRRVSGFPRRVGAALHGRELISKPFASSPVVQRAYDEIRKRALGESDVLFPISRYTQSLLEPYSARRVCVANNGVNAVEFRPDAELGASFRKKYGLGPGPLLLTIGRLVQRKGVDTVLEALPELVREQPHLTYAIAGDGPDRSRLEALADARTLRGRVRFLGAVPASDLVPAYNACDVFVMPSRSDGRDVEGFGLVFLEAGACGKPVLGARSGGVPDAIVDGSTGFLVEPAAPRELAAKLRELLADSELRARLGHAGRAHVLRQGTWDHTCDTIYAALGET